MISSRACSAMLPRVTTSKPKRKDSCSTQASWPISSHTVLTLVNPCSCAASSIIFSTLSASDISCIFLLLPKSKLNCCSQSFQLCIYQAPPTLQIAIRTQFTHPLRCRLQIGRCLIAQWVAKFEIVTANAQQEGGRRIYSIHLPVGMQQRERGHHMAGVAAVLFGGDFGEMERLDAGHIGIDEQHSIATQQVGDLLDLQLVILDQLDPPCRLR